MPCFTRRIDDDQMVVNASLRSSALSPRPAAAAGRGARERGIVVPALIDTGATVCGISSKLARDIAAASVSKTEVFTANGVARVNLFLVDIHVMMEEEDAVVAFSDVSAMEFPDDGSDIPVILGMELIRAGSLHVSGHVFTFAL